MTHPDRQDHERGDAVQPRKPEPPADAPQISDQEHGWLERVRRLLERAERRITENFRAPPGGG